MNVQPKLSTLNHCMPADRPARAALRAPRPAVEPRSVLGLPDGRILAPGEVP
jgi:hypothetical protein